MKNGLFESLLILIVLMPLGIFYLKTIFKILDRMVPRRRPRPAVELEAESIEEEIALEVKRRNQMIDKVVQYSTKEPEKFTSLLANWLINGGAH